MITQERKAELIAAGYVIEDMGAEWVPTLPVSIVGSTTSIQWREMDLASSSIPKPTPGSTPRNSMRNTPMATEKIKVPVPKPHCRTPIPPVRKERDRKNDYKRQPKHKKPPLDG